MGVSDGPMPLIDQRAICTVVLPYLLFLYIALEHTGISLIIRIQIQRQNEISVVRFFKKISTVNVFS